MQHVAWWGRHNYSPLSITDTSESRAVSGELGSGDEKDKVHLVGRHRSSLTYTTAFPRGSSVAAKTPLVEVHHCLHIALSSSRSGSNTLEPSERSLHRLVACPRCRFEVGRILRKEQSLGFSARLPLSGLGARPSASLPLRGDQTDEIVSCMGCMMGFISPDMFPLYKDTYFCQEGADDLASSN